MPYVTTKEMLQDAGKKGYAVCAFNAENMEMILAILDTAQEMRAPVIIQTTPSTLKYASPLQFAANVKAAVRERDVTCALHLDHGDSYALAAKAVRAGYSSVMIDGSKMVLDENIAFTAKTTELCHAVGVPVEAELGRVGGKEDNVQADGPVYTDPEEAVRFVKETNVDSFAVAIGTAHGVYKGEPKLDTALLSEIRSLVNIPLVLHGTSGVPLETVRDCISRGICKVNYATDLRIAYTKGIREYLAKDGDAFDPKKYGAAGMALVRECVRERILNCGGDGKA